MLVTLAGLRTHRALHATCPAGCAPPATSPAHSRPRIGRRPTVFMPAAAHLRLGRRCVSATAEARGARLSVAGGYMSELT